TYTLPTISLEIDTVIIDFYKNTLGSYWDKERKYVDEKYETIPFPFLEIETPVFKIYNQWTPEELEGFLNTWSALQKFIEINSFNPVDEVINKIRSILKDKKMNIVFPVHLRIGQIDK
ncbi:MAG: SAM-dependent methyltransferase, partial [Bacteroidia bacterium]|nr:SAM-dependent methyltransferase [Bacteroidia bacterium]